MSFWSDASPIVKVAVVVGALGIIVFGMMFLQIPPFDPYDGEDIGNQRGVQAP